MRECPGCGSEADAAYRYCPWCAAPLRLKVVEFFRGHAAIDRAKALRVSRYLSSERPGRHVRFSVWTESENDARAEAALSLDDDEAARLGHFLLDTAPRRRQRSLLERIYVSLSR